jgi:chemotaxis protein CheY-P-specific phosphatase CheC
VSEPAYEPAEIARQCARGAAHALGQLVGGDLTVEPLRGWAIEGGRMPVGPFAPGERVAAVLAELEGSVAGPAGLLLRPDALQWVVGRLTGDTNVSTLSERALSALCEVGNIAVSAAANVLSERLGGVVLPSVPRLGFEKPAESVLAELCGELGRRTAYLIEVELRGAQTALRLLYVWIPE